MKEKGSAPTLFLQTWVESPNHNQYKSKTHQNPLFQTWNWCGLMWGEAKEGKQSID
jgi:hypothetical protein